VSGQAVSLKGSQSRAQPVGLGRWISAFQAGVGLVFGIGRPGWTALPMLMGTYAWRTRVQRVFLLAAASAVGLCVIGLVLVAGVGG